MILNIDFSPGIDRCLYLEDMKIGEINSLESSDIRLNGSGATLEYLLNLVNESSVLTGFLGNKNKEVYRKLLPGNTRTAFVHTKDDLYERVRIIEKSGRETSFDMISRITKEEITEFINSYHSLVGRCEYIVGFDDLTRELPKDYLENLVKIAYLQDKCFILEVKNKNTIKSLSEKPNIVIINKEMLEETTRLVMDSVSAIAYGTNTILDKGAELVFVNLYEDGIIYSDSKYKYHVSGANFEFIKNENHALIASILVGLKRKYALEVFLKMCYSYNAAFNSIYDLYDVSTTDVKTGMSDVKIKRIR